MKFVIFLNSELQCEPARIQPHAIGAHEAAFVMRIWHNAAATCMGPSSVRAVKNTDEDLTRVVTNLDELRGAFVGGPWASIFDVDPVRERRSYHRAREEWRSYLHASPRQEGPREADEAAACQGR